LHTEKGLTPSFPLFFLPAFVCCGSPSTHPSSHVTFSHPDCTPSLFFSHNIFEILYAADYGCTQTWFRLPASPQLPCSPLFPFPAACLYLLRLGEHPSLVSHHAPDCFLLCSVLQRPQNRTASLFILDEVPLDI
jgi:hypothetical protein